MRLADFILANIEPILADWETFARDHWPGASTDPKTLRDHAEQILRTTARDMVTAQSDGEQDAKSKGHGDASHPSDQVDGAAAVHASGRLRSGFDVLLLIAEYRALRASVLKLWRVSTPEPTLPDIDDITRFNESIDQSLTTAVTSYSREADRSREMFLAILGHDLRNPLSTISLVASVIPLQGKVKDTPTLDMIHQISESSLAMGRIISDLLDFASARLGGAMPISTSTTDLGRLCRDVVRETRAGHPKCAVDFDGPAESPAGSDAKARGENVVRHDGDGKIVGDWDAMRLRQLVSNLLSNAIQHGDAASPVKLGLRLDGDDAILTVHNAGDPIPRDKWSTIFNPLVRDVRPDALYTRRKGSIGLGLYIAREVVLSHGGTIEVASSAQAGTTFTVRLPRHRTSGRV